MRQIFAFMCCGIVVWTGGPSFGADGIVFPDDFNYDKGYSLYSVPDGGGLNASITNTFFTKAVWKASADAPLASVEAGKNYFQNGLLTANGSGVFLNGPFTAAMTAEQAAPYLTFAGNKLVLGGNKAVDLDAHLFCLWNGSSAAGEEGLEDAATKPYLFGGDGLVMAGNCVLSLGRHAALAGTLTVLSDDHDEWRVAQTNASNFLSHNTERWTRAQCSRIEANDHVNAWSIDIQSTLVGDTNAFLCFHRSGHVNVNPDRRNVCQISGDASAYRGTLAVESNCVLRVKTALTNASVKVGYRGWGMKVYTGTTGSETEYVWDRFDPVSSGSGTLEVPVDKAVSIRRVENNCGLVSVLSGASLAVEDLVCKGGEFALAISPTVGKSASVTVNGALQLAAAPIRIRLVGSASAMPQGERVPLFRWRASDNPALDANDFDFTSSVNFGLNCVGRGYPVVKTENGVSTLYLDCTEICYRTTPYDSATCSCFTNAAGWSDGQMPHVDANYFGNGDGNHLCSIKQQGAMLFPDGMTVPYQEFHGNRLRLGYNEGMVVEGRGNVLYFPGDGLVLQQGGNLTFLDPGIVVSGRIHVASLYTLPTSSAQANASGLRNSASNSRPNTFVPATVTGDRRAELTLQMRNSDAKFATNGFDVVFSGDVSGYYGTFICETNTTLFLDRGLPNGTVKLGGIGLPFTTGLGSLDGDNNGRLSATVSNTEITISNLVVNGSTVVAENGNTYALKALTLNGGTLRIAPKAGTAPFVVEGPVTLTHQTKVMLETLPQRDVPCELIRWPVSENSIDLDMIAVVDSAGHVLQPDVYVVEIVPDVDGRSLVVSKKNRGTVITLL